MAKSHDRRLQLSVSMAKLVLYCESTCVAECCGLDACEFTKDNFTRWLRDYPDDRDTVLREFESLLREIEVQSEETVSSREFNAVWRKSEAIMFFRKLHELLKGVA